MKKALLVLVCLLAVCVFTSGGMAAQQSTTQGKALKASGTVLTYDPGAMIAVKTAKGKEMHFDLAANAKVGSKVDRGSKVTVTYKKQGQKLVAAAVAVSTKK
ncbi:MAG: hypothetical protein E4H48_04015 [Syntrophobacterales bacterium]|nr:MAG: hypothetical protein E4H48_04015 [Syntrophobacterales bacterium]